MIDVYWTCPHGCRVRLDRVMCHDGDDIDWDADAFNLAASVHHRLMHQD